VRIGPQRPYPIAAQLSEVSMRRREFIKITAGSIATASLASFSAVAGSGKAITVDALQLDLYRRVRRYAKTPFGDIAYIDVGSVRRVALLLHGFPLNSFQWRDVIDRVCMYRRCIAPDFLAMGYTRTNYGQDVGPESQVAMLVSLLDTLAISSVDIIASDSGGAIAQLFVVKHPELVRTLLLTNCDSEIESPPNALLPVIELAKQGKYADQWLAPWLANKALARSKDGIGGLCYSDPTKPTDEAIEMYFAPLLASSDRKALVERYVIALERNPLSGIEQDLKRSTVAARIVWGMADTIFSAASAEYLDRTFGKSRGIRRVESGKLFWPEEYPAIISEEALELWNVSLLCPDSQCEESPGLAT
jgi:haloalkane dehalogenase